MTNTVGILILPLNCSAENESLDFIHKMYSLCIYVSMYLCLYVSMSLCIYVYVYAYMYIYAHNYIVEDTMG